MKVRKKIQNSPFKHKLQGFLEEWSHSSAPGRTAHVISQEEMGLKQQKSNIYWQGGQGVSRACWNGGREGIRGNLYGKKQNEEPGLSPSSVVWQPQELMRLERKIPQAAELGKSSSSKGKTASQGEKSG